MRFICLEVEKTPIDKLKSNLFKISEENLEYLVDEDGNQLTRFFEIEEDNQKPVYVYGRSILSDYFQSITLNSAKQTVSEFETNSGIAITDNLGTFTDDFYWLVNTVLDKEFYSDYWFTVFADDGLHFIKPERSSTSRPIDNFDFLGKIDRESYFDSVDYAGETGSNFTISDTSRTIVPVVIDDDLKEMALNKFMSKNSVAIIQSSQYASPGDYFVQDGIEYIILSKTYINDDYFQYVGVQVANESYTFTAGDVYPETNIIGNQTSYQKEYRNYIINGNFDVWQRGTSFTKANNPGAYVADRWIMSQAGNGVRDELITQGTLSDGDVVGSQYYYETKQYKASEFGGGHSKIIQIIDSKNARKLAGKTVTLSFYYRNTGISGSSDWTNDWLAGLIYDTDDSTLSLTGQQATAGIVGTGIDSVTLSDVSEWTRETLTVNIPNTAQRILVYFISYSNTVNGATMQLTQVQLTETDEAVPYVAKSIENEIDDCKRYYQVMTSSEFQSRISFYDSSRVQCQVPMEKEMRTIPTITLGSGWKLYPINSGTEVTGFTWSALAISTTYWTIRGTQASHGQTDGRILQSSTYDAELDAEL